jgi:FMN-dependent NADH-azoreductase
MTHLLHLDASPRPTAFSRRVGDAFITEWRHAHPNSAYTYRDLTANPVPLVDVARTELAAQSSAAGVRDLAGMAAVVRTAAQRTAWDVTRPLIEEILAADVLLVATPMYNFSIPAALKAWIDQVSFPWLSFKNRAVVVVTGRGGSYAPGTPRAHLDFQEPYLRAYFDTLGAQRITFIHAELSNAPIVPFLAQFTDAHVESVDKALATARTLAHTLPGGLPAEAAV